MKVVFFLLAWLGCSAVDPLFAEIKVSATIDKTKVTLGESFEIQVVVSGDYKEARLPEPQIQNLSAFNLLNKSAQQSSSSSMQIIINGQNITQNNERKTSFQYILSPKSLGQHPLGPIEYEYQGKKYVVQATTIDVANQTVKVQDAIYSVHVNKKTAFVGEQLVLTISFKKLAGANVNNPSLNGLEELTQKLSKKFIVQDIGKSPDKVRPSVTMIDGRRFEVFDVKYALFPISSGSLKVDPTMATYQAVLSGRSGSSLFDDFFFGSRTQTKTLVSQEFTIQVKDLPAPFPAQFSGSVGQFQMALTIDRNILPAGEPLTLNITISGFGEMKSVKSPQFPSLADFERFDPEVTAKSEVRDDKIYGEKKFKYVLVPQKPGQYKINPLEYTVFDIKGESYKTLRTAPLDIKVIPGKSLVQAPSQVFLSKSVIQQVGTDIRYLKPDKSVLHQVQPVWRNSRFILFQIIPLIGILFSYLYQSKRERLVADVGYARLKRSTREAKKRLKEAKGQKDVKFFYSQINTALLAYLGDKFNLAAAGLTDDKVIQILKERNISSSLIDRFMGCKTICDYARFAPQADGTQKREEIYQIAVDVILALEKEIKVV